MVQSQIRRALARTKGVAIVVHGKCVARTSRAVVGGVCAFLFLVCVLICGSRSATRGQRSCVADSVRGPSREGILNRSTHGVDRDDSERRATDSSPQAQKRPRWLRHKFAVCRIELLYHQGGLTRRPTDGVRVCTNPGCALGLSQGETRPIGFSRRHDNPNTLCSVEQVVKGMSHRLLIVG